MRLARLPLLVRLLSKLGILDRNQYAFAVFARSAGVEYGDAVKGLPLADGSADVIYASHVLEHLDRRQAGAFLDEARRVLSDGGVLRLAVPDLRGQVEHYLETGDADQFIEAMMLAPPATVSLVQRLRLLIMGNRHHQWMYDGESLARFLCLHGFRDVRILDAGETGIDEPGSLDLHERSDESVYVEGRK